MEGEESGREENKYASYFLIFYLFFGKTHALYPQWQRSPAADGPIFVGLGGKKAEKKTHTHTHAPHKKKEKKKAAN